MTNKLEVGHCLSCCKKMGEGRNELHLCNSYEDYQLKHTKSGPLCAAGWCTPQLPFQQELTAFNTMSKKPMKKNPLFTSTELDNLRIIPFDTKLEELEDHYWQHQAMKVLFADYREPIVPDATIGFGDDREDPQQLEFDEPHVLIDDIRRGTPLHLRLLDKELNKQLIEMRSWLLDPMNWNDHIHYMIEVLEASRMDKKEKEEPTLIIHLYDDHNPPNPICGAITTTTIVPMSRHDEFKDGSLGDICKECVKKMEEDTI